MADNFIANPGSGGASFAADDVGGGLLVPRVKVQVGRDGFAADTASGYRRLSTADTNLATVKASPGSIYAILATNTNAAARYLKLYNKAANPTLASDTPLWTVAIPGAAAGAGVALPLPAGLDFSTGIALAITTGVADTDTGALAANEVIVNLAYV